MLDQKQVEPLDSHLIEKLERVQNEAEEIMSAIILKRRCVPKFYSAILKKQIYQADNSELVKENSMPQTPLKLNSPKKITYASSPIDAIRKLSSTIPELCAKLQRAKQVLAEEGKRNHGGNEEQHTFDGNKDIGKNLLKHRRASQHFDIASRLSLGCTQEKDLI